MSLKIFKYLVILLMISRITHQQTTPEERCEAAGDGTTVCIDCFRSGTCVLTDGTYTVIENFVCPSSSTSQSYCDDTLFSPGTYGTCSPIPATTTDCGCSSTSQCTTDPNNPAVILHCEASPPVSDDACSPPAVDLSTCSCLSCSDTCPLLDDPNDDCGSYFVCTGSTLINVTCTGTLCFEQELCGCVDNGGITTAQSTTTTSSSTSSSSSSTSSSSSSTSNPITCPDGCPFADDPNDNCGSYFVCAGTQLINVTCVGTFCFNQELCGCMDNGGLSTEPPTIPSTQVTSVTCPPGCPFLDDPDDTCKSYFICTGTDLIPVDCVGALCFDQELCGCVDKGGSSAEPSTTEVTEPITTTTTPVTTTPVTTTPVTTTPQTPTTCPPGCPFVDDPTDPCAAFYICDGGVLLPSQCPGILCFDQPTCMCK